ncbi:translationally-controlled tumor protein homolog [Ylistrum balloti]|uniref:translationally-controlled tumor protein homolog n=1 Tax=Ylistrum balloti TaxID=509963 RepID=UPI002905BC4A|nr:translationally-controlled tumor protein homolog [Ylistrum balloti]
MKVYKDIMTGNEMISDSFKITMHEPVRGMMTVKGKMKKEDGVPDIDIGANASKEEESEQLQEAEGQLGVDVVIDFRLKETEMTKKDLKLLMKEKMKGLLAKKTEEAKKDETVDVNGFKADCQKMVEWALKNFEDIQLYIGEDYDEDCMPVFLINRGGEDIHMYYFHHALIEEKY